MRIFSFFLGVAVISAAFHSSAFAEVVERKVEYKQGDTQLVGYVYADSESKGQLPGVLVFSDWMGVGEFSKSTAKDLAKLGYVAFVADIYGEGKQAKDQKEAGELAGKFKGDRPLMRNRAQAALDALLTIKGERYSLDSKRIAAIGFCFGGTASLELSRSGAPLRGVVSFHGGLETPDVKLAKNIKAQILVLHGADDPYVPETEVQAFEKEMKEGGVNWELVKFSKTVHAFTNPAAGNDNSKGAAFNEVASKRAFQAMKNFFAEVL